jgi:hypothetical protein
MKVIENQSGNIVARQRAQRRSKDCARLLEITGYDKP